MSELLTVGDLSFELRRSDKRKTIGITVERNGSLIVTAPLDCPLDTIKAVAEEKRPWVYIKLAEKEMLSRPARAKEFITGENFFYLGRSYRLLLFESAEPLGKVPPLRLYEGRFMLRKDEVERASLHFTNWYTQHGVAWLERRAELFTDRVGVKQGKVGVLDLGYRWGSCGAGGSLNFHWRTILLPPKIIEYIVVHELVHLLEPHHNQDFWKRLKRAMPDQSARKLWLAENGSNFY